MARLILILISCFMFILVVREFARSVGTRRRQNVRIVVDPGGEEWLTIDEVAAHLETTRSEILNLIERDSIPFYVDAVLDRREPGAYRFNREEIDDWVIG
jgi:excisionase family DNA binding protein